MDQRDTYHHGALRTTLVSEGLKQLEQHGDAGVSLRALAKAAGVSPNAPYRHFDDKNALMAALAAEGFLKFADAITTAGEGESPLGVLRAQGEAYLEFAGAHPALYRLMFSPYGYSLHSQTCQTQSERAFGALVAAAARAQEAGWRADRDLVSVVLTYWAALHGWAGLVGERLVPPEIPIPNPKTWLDTLLGSENS